MTDSPAVSLSLLRDSEMVLVLGYEIDGEIEALATADAGRVELYRNQP